MRNSIYSVTVVFSVQAGLAPLSSAAEALDLDGAMSVVSDEQDAREGHFVYAYVELVSAMSSEIAEAIASNTVKDALAKRMFDIEKTYSIPLR